MMKTEFPFESGIGLNQGVFWQISYQDATAVCVFQVSIEFGERNVARAGNRPSDSAVVVRHGENQIKRFLDAVITSN